ncbi:MAG: CPBP family intramembrane metalloprotease [Desulfovibrionaceae bacterium]|nr:CPBP family intramembrane metalloprotease [Desulfovibrionaceae bacterium]
MSRSGLARPFPPGPALCLAALPFFVNDFFNIRVQDPGLWLGLDYLFRLGPLLFLALLVRAGRLAPADLGLSPLAWPRFLAWFAVLVLAGLALDRFGLRVLELWLPGTALGRIPQIADPGLRLLDLSLGLGLVAISEEIVFRGLARSALAGLGAWPCVVLSGLVFGAGHWSLGLAACLNAALIGALFMVSTMRAKSVWPAAAAHYVINLVYFSGLGA